MEQKRGQEHLANSAICLLIQFRSFPFSRREIHGSRREIHGIASNSVKVLSCSLPMFILVAKDCSVAHDPESSNDAATLLIPSTHGHGLEASLRRLA